MANRAKFADHNQAIYGSADRSIFAYRGYWLTKRRDGRSGNWMIARYEKQNKSVIYKSCKTTDLEQARRQLVAFAEANPEGYQPPAVRSSELVYFAEAETGQIKIGVARDVEKRLAQVATISPVSIALLAVTLGGRAQEREYHIRFAQHRLHGEWFNPHQDILAEIEHLGALSSRGAV